MRVIVFVKATKDSENGVPPSQELLLAMGKFNEELVKAGIMLDGAGLKPSKEGARVRFSGDKRSVIDGPFPEAIEWVKRCPNPMLTDSEIEIRPFFEMGDFEMNDAAKAQHEKVASELGKK